MVGSVLTFVVLAVLAEAMAFLLYAAAEDPKPSLLTTARVGGLVFYVFHHVGLVFELPPAGISDFPIPSGFTVAGAALGGTAILLWLLGRTGRAIGRGMSGPGWVRGLAGAKVALPYAVLSLVVSFAVKVPSDVLERTGSPAIHPSYLPAFFWPLVLGVFAGFTGGFVAAGRDAWPAGAVGRRLRGAVAGGMWMMGLALALAFVGLVILAPLHPDGAADYFGTFDHKVTEGIALVAATIFVVPNLCAAILFPAMGTCLSAGGNVFGFGTSFCYLSWTQFPGSSTGSGGLDFPNPPAGYFLYLLVPLVAVVVGGSMAARRAEAGSREEATAVGAAAGVVFGVLSVLLGVLVTLSFKGGAGGFGGAFHGSTGPEFMPGILWAFLWGIVGGAIGGLFEGRRSPARVSIRV